MSHLGCLGNFVMTAFVPGQGFVHTPGLHVTNLHIRLCRGYLRFRECHTVLGMYDQGRLTYVDNSMRHCFGNIIKSIIRIHTAMPTYTKTRGAIHELH